MATPITNNWDIETYQKAWLFASLAHQHQSYGGHVPQMQINYLNHIGAVAAEIAWLIANTSEKIDANLAIQCALLHDTLEDTDTTYQQICEKFGKPVANGVQALTKNKDLPKEEQMTDSLQRICQQPAEIGMVKMADRICNLYHPPHYWTKEKIESYRQEAILIWINLKDKNTIIGERLHQKIESYKRFLEKEKQRYE